MKLIFASNNEHKIKEIRSILGNSFTLVSLSDLNIREDILATLRDKVKSAGMWAPQVSKEFGGD